MNRVAKAASNTSKPYSGKARNNQSRRAISGETQSPTSNGVNQQEIAASTTQPHTDLPDTAKNQAPLQTSEELVLVYMPARMTYMLMRGQQSMAIGAVEMAGILAMGAFNNTKVQAQ